MGRQRAIASGDGAMNAIFGTTIQPNPVAAFLLQTAAMGTCAGTLIAYRRRQRDRDFDTFPIITRWTVAGGLFGVLCVLVASLL
jgi:uncharacterized membrane protein YdcZ (DUF606 family)